MSAANTEGMTAPLPEDVIRQALTAAKLVYKPHINVGIINNRLVLKLHVAPFAADPQTKIAQLYKRCADAGAPMKAIEWGAVSSRYDGCQELRFTINPLEKSDAQRNGS